MKSSVFGLISGILIVGYAVAQTGNDTASYINLVSILIVFGGTISAAVITHGLKKNYEIFKMFFKAFKTSKYDNVKIVKELTNVSKKMHAGEQIDQLMKLDLHPFIKDGLRLIHNEFNDKKITHICRTMLNERKSFYSSNIEQMEVLAKYPPAFGMMGTIIGLIAVMKQMGAESGIETVGPSMAVALVTTLYGIFIANYIIHPISDNLTSRSQRDLKIRRIISEGILLLNQNENPIYVREALMGYLLPEERTSVASDFASSQDQFGQKDAA